MHACEFYGANGPQLAAPAIGMPLVALESIPVGADVSTIARRRVVLLLDGCAGLSDAVGRELSSDQQSLVREIGALLASGCDDASVFRALRRIATAATGDLETAVLRFAEAVAWPFVAFEAALPPITARLHFELRSLLAPERPSLAARATIEAMSALYRALSKRFDAEPGIDTQAEIAKLEATPKFAAATDPGFRARVDGYDCAATEKYAPFAIDVLLESIRAA